MSDRFVYFIQRGGTDGPVKVGISDNPQTRLDQLQSAHFETLSLIGTTPGHRGTEHKIHNQLAAYSLGREWYSPCELLFELIEIRTPNLSGAIQTARSARECLRLAVKAFANHEVAHARDHLVRARELIELAIDSMVADEVAA